MKKHFLILMLMALLPFAGWAAANPEPKNLEYTGAAQALITGPEWYYAVVPAGAAAPAYNEYAEGIPQKTNAGSYDVYYVSVEPTSEEVLAAAETKGHITATIAKKQIVYFLTGSTYAVGDKPEVTNHYAIATGEFVAGEKLSDYAEFAFPTSGNDALDLDANGRFTTIKTYNVTALRVVELNPIQNYDFRFTSTAAIVVTAKSIISFVASEVADQQYTGSEIHPAILPTLYPTIADMTADENALDPSNYDVTYTDNTHNNIDVAQGGVIIYTGKGNYEGSVTIPFNIVKRELASVEVAEIGDITYAYGAQIKPVLTVTGKDAQNNEYTLAATDYSVDYNGSNVNVGNAEGVLTATVGGNFTFPAATSVGNATFTIVQKSLADTDIKITAIDNQTYTAAPLTPGTTVKWVIGETENDITDLIEFEYQHNDAVGTATIIAKPKAANDPQNYKDQKQATFSILPTSLTESGNVTISLEKLRDNTEDTWDPAEYSYEGREIKPGTVKEGKYPDGRLVVKDGETLLKLGEDYVISSYGGEGFDNKNASHGEVHAAVTIQGIGNYGAIDALGYPITKTKTFDIAKATVTFSAVEKTTTFGVAPTLSAENDAFESIGGQLTYTVEVNNGTTETPDWQLYDGEMTALAVGTEYRYTPVWTPTTVEPAENPNPAVTYSTAEEVAARDNYDIDNIAYENAPIIVNNALWVVVPDDQTKRYGVADAALTFTYKVYNGSVAPANLVENPVFTTPPVFGRLEANQGEDVKEGGYTISITNADAVAAEGYAFNFDATATLTITPFPITVTANNQTIFYGSTPNLQTKSDSWVKVVANGEEAVGEELTVTFSPVMTGNQELIDRESLGLTLTWNEEGTIGTHEGALVPSISNPNFTIEEEFGGKAIAGNVEVVGGVLILSNAAEYDNDALIKDYDGKEDVKVLLNRKITRTEAWFSMVLPFEIKVAELSQKFGYAVVNTLDESNTTPSKVKFKLNMSTIAANQPFLVKVAEPIAVDGPVDFGTRELIEYVEDPKSTDAAGNEFHGIYKQTELEASPYLWVMVPAQDKFRRLDQAGTTLNPINAYLKTAQELDAFAPAIYVEDIDGSVTAINAIGVEIQQNGEGWYNLNGMKLQGAPTQKGVYIQKGKKVVLK